MMGQAASGPPHYRRDKLRLPHPVPDPPLMARKSCSEGKQRPQSDDDNRDDEEDETNDDAPSSPSPRKHPAHSSKRVKQSL
jgi:hypothetical protein